MKDDQLKALCKILSQNFTHPQIDKMLKENNIENISEKSISNQYGFVPGSNKLDKLFNSLKNTSDTNIYKFIEKCVNPILYTDFSARDKYKMLVEDLNKILLFDGKEINSSGKIKVVVQASTLDEVDRRVNSLAKQMYDRKIHYEVQKYCTKELLKKDYFDAVFESAKGLAERVRNITGLTTDGSALFQTAFSKNDPYIFFNSLQTESELNEHNGLKELLESIFHLVRNPQAHTPKINWPIEEDKALDILTVISFAHKYLDLCNKMPGK